MRNHFMAGFREPRYKEPAGNETVEQQQKKNLLLMKGRHEVRAGCLCQQRNEEGESVFFYVSTEPGEVLNIQHEENKQTDVTFPKSRERYVTAAKEFTARYIEIL